MLYSKILLPCFLAMGAKAQDSESSLSSASSSGASSGSSSSSTTTGVTEAATPTGPYVSYSTTITRDTTTTSSAISTSAIVSTVTSGSTTITTTLGSTTIFGIGVIVGNATVSSNSTTTTTPTQTYLSGRPHTTVSSNSTSNSTATSTSATPEATNTTPCNNYPEFCARRYGNITEVSAHNSPFVKSGNAGANQALDVTTQLNDGIRQLQGQMHFVNSTPHFCHTSCDILDSGPITDYLTTVYNWVVGHPYDVVTLLLENGDYKPVQSYVPFIQQTGLDKFAYTPPKIPMGLDDWPTLAYMILTGKRVVIFMDYDANQTAVPWILDEFSQMWETPFDPTDRTFPCTVQRPPDLAAGDAQSRLYMTNHDLNFNINLLGNSLLVPNIPLLNQTNNVTGFGSLGLGAEQCTAMWGFPPKFLNVDYYNVGNGSVFEVAAKYNNVTYNRACCGLPVSGGTMNEIVGRSAMLMAICVVWVTWWLL